MIGMNDVWKELCENIAGKLRVEHERIESLPDKEKIVDNFLRSQQDEIVECFISLWDEYLDQVAPIVSIDAEASEDESESVEADNPPAEANSQSNPAPEAAPEVNPKHDEPERPQKTIPVLYEYYPEPPPWPKPKPDPSPSSEQQSSSTPPILPMPLLTGKLMLRDKQIIFPNGRVNQQYVVDCLSIRRQTDIYDIYFEGLEQIGLRYDRKSSHIIGTPHEAGDFPVKMFYRKPNQQKYSSHNMILIINHDPRSLWKPIPTSPSIEYYKEDSAMQFVLVDDGPIAKKDMVGASRRGRSHAQEGKARDDDFALDFEDGWYIMVVADGAGSAPYSRKGSEMACRIIVEESKRQLGLKQEQFKDLIGSYHSNPSKESNKAAGDVLYTILGAAAFKAVSAIKHEAESKGRAVKDYATTLLAAICRKFSFGWFVGSFWVGDGGMG
ncbi:MAG: protein phosphatase 2C domain-containing protein, partial [Tannerellaceae bacterium]|nr:protein phosphatase 2C domain-containing protein [Tannerellaceae bacterium]